MFCQKCGSPLAKDAGFCVGCGTKVASGQTESGSAPAADPLQRGTSNEKSARNHNASGTLMGAVTNSQQQLSGKQALKVVIGLLLVSGTGGVLVAMHDDRTAQAATNTSQMPADSTTTDVGGLNGTYVCENLGPFKFAGSTVTVKTSAGDARTIAFKMNGDSVLLNTAGEEWFAMLTYKGGKLYHPEVGDSLGTMQLKECIKQ